MSLNFNLSCDKCIKQLCKSGHGYRGIRRIGYVNDNIRRRLLISIHLTCQETRAKNGEIRKNKHIKAAEWNMYARSGESLLHYRRENEVSNARTKNGLEGA